jgi:hypothetical protein
MRNNVRATHWLDFLRTKTLRLCAAADRHWKAKKNDTYPGSPIVPGSQQDVDFMVKDSKRFADSGGWGYGAFEYDSATKTFRPATQSDQPPQANDAKCGYACHIVVKSRDYVFTDYPSK